MLMRHCIDGSFGRQVMKALCAPRLQGFRQISKFGQVRNVTGVEQLAMAAGAMKIAVKHLKSASVAWAADRREADIEVDRVMATRVSLMPVEGQAFGGEPHLRIKGPFGINGHVHPLTDELDPSQIPVINGIKPLNVIHDTIGVGFHRAIYQIRIEHW